MGRSRRDTCTCEPEASTYRQPVQDFQAPPDEIGTDRDRERNLDQLYDQLISGHCCIRSARWLWKLPAVALSVIASGHHTLTATHEFAPAPRSMPMPSERWSLQSMGPQIGCSPIRCLPAA